MRFFLLPEDVDLLMEAFNRSVGCRLYQAKMPSNALVEVSGKTTERCYQLRNDLLSYDRCYVAPLRGADVRTQFIEQQGYWLIDPESGAIEFDGCSYNEFFLVEGRFYYQIDLLSAEKHEIVPKSKDFVIWAEQVFKRAKKLLHHDKELQAYIGPEAAAWRLKGGQLVHSEVAIPMPQPSAKAWLV